MLQGEGLPGLAPSTDLVLLNPDGSVMKPLAIPSFRSDELPGKGPCLPIECFRLNMELGANTDCAQLACLSGRGTTPVLQLTASVWSPAGHASNKVCIDALLAAATPAPVEALCGPLLAAQLAQAKAALLALVCAVPCLWRQVQPCTAAPVAAAATPAQVEPGCLGNVQDLLQVSTGCLGGSAETVHLPRCHKSCHCRCRP